jgi:NADH-quinone oxidoreductase E subunit
MSNLNDNFSFNETNEREAEKILAKYPTDRKQSAIMPLLDLAQRQNDNWLSRDVVEYVANFIEIPFIKAWEVVTFYSMYYTKYNGKYLVQVCGTTPCWLRGSDQVAKACKEMISPDQNTLSKDGLFSWTQVECLGACVNAPLVQINDDYYEDLTYDTTKNILQSLKDGIEIKVGSQNGRTSSKAVS